MGSVGKALSGILGTVGSFIPGVGPLLGLAGGIGNLISGSQQGGAAGAGSQALGTATNALSQYANNLYGMTPQQLTSRLQAMEQPLSQNLINNTANQVIPMMALGGQAQSAGQVANAMGTALAPYNLQEQQMAQNLMNMQFQLPAQMQSDILSAFSGLAKWPQPANTAGAFSGGGGLGGGSQGAIWPGFPGTLGGTPAVPSGPSLPTTIGTLPGGWGGLTPIGGDMPAPNFTGMIS